MHVNCIVYTRLYFVAFEMIFIDIILTRVNKAAYFCKNLPILLFNIAYVSIFAYFCPDLPRLFIGSQFHKISDNERTKAPRKETFEKG